MEIERKWAMQKEPPLPPRCRLRVEQSYLSLSPEVRVRRYEDLGSRELRYDLTIKSEGTIAREEIIKDLTEEEYRVLAAMAGGEPIVKEYSNYDYQGRVLEFSVVDPGRQSGFTYAEVEFPTLEEAQAFQAPDWFGEETTHKPGARMKEYWRQPRLEGR